MVSAGEKPAVISALLKYVSTDRMRQSVNDALDIHGGRGICDGPSNYLQGAYQMVPVGITVEGANILTRTLITFAQGALRSHPYLIAEIEALQDQDSEPSIAISRSPSPTPSGRCSTTLHSAPLHPLPAMPAPRAIGGGSSRALRDPSRSSPISPWRCSAAR
jgi:hypothetical protein